MWALKCRGQKLNMQRGHVVLPGVQLLASWAQSLSTKPLLGGLHHSIRMGGRRVTSTPPMRIRSRRSGFSRGTHNEPPSTTSFPPILVACAQILWRTALQASGGMVRRRTCRIRSSSQYENKHRGHSAVAPRQPGRPAWHMLVSSVLGGTLHHSIRTGGCFRRTRPSRLNESSRTTFGRDDDVGATSWFPIRVRARRSGCEKAMPEGTESTFRDGRKTLVARVWCFAATMPPPGGSSLRRQPRKGLGRHQRLAPRILRFLGGIPQIWKSNPQAGWIGPLTLPAV
jgi:hypothetical protein